MTISVYRRCCRWTQCVLGLWTFFFYSGFCQQMVFPGMSWMCWHKRSNAAWILGPFCSCRSKKKKSTKFLFFLICYKEQLHLLMKIMCYDQKVWASVERIHLDLLLGLSRIKSFDRTKITMAKQLLSLLLNNEKVTFVEHFSSLIEH